MRPACTDKDYFYTHTACDANGEVCGRLGASLPRLFPLPAPCFTTFRVLPASVAGTRENSPDLCSDPGASGRQNKMASFLFRPETAFASLVPLCIHIYSVSECHLIFCCLVSSICLAPLGKDCLSMHTVSSWNSSDLSPQCGFCGLAKGIDSSFLTHWRMACSAPAGSLGSQGFLPQEDLPL